MKIGTNISGILDWSAQIVFKDAMKLSRQFTITPANRPIDYREGLSVVKLPETWLDRYGYPTEVPYTPPGKSMSIRLSAILFCDIPGLYPAGEYTLRFDGKGQIALTGASGTHIIDSSGEKTCYKFHVDPSIKEGIDLCITYSKPGNHIRNIEVILPGFENDDLCAAPFHPVFMEGLKGFSVLRFVGESGHTPFNMIEPMPVIKWSQRNLPASRSQSSLTSRWWSCGLALEYMVRMANELNSDLWLCTGYQWNDHFLAEAAKLIKGSLKPSLKLWLEYSNDLWCSEYVQHKYAKEQASRKGFPKGLHDATSQWAVHRSVRVWEIFGEVFGGFGRIVKVLCGHTEDYKLTESRMNCLDEPLCNPGSLRPDVLGIAPYINPGVVTGKETVKDILTKCKSCIQLLDANLAGFKGLAEKHQVGLVCYSGGLDIRSNSMEGLSTSKLVVRDESMYKIYSRFLDMLKGHDVKLFNQSNYTGGWDTYGLWSLLEHTGEAFSLSPRYMALKDFIRNGGSISGLQL